MSLVRQSLRALKAGTLPSWPSCSASLSIREADLGIFAAAKPSVLRPAGARFSSSDIDYPTVSSDPEVVIPELHQTLEWCLSSPAPVHQFEEPPLVIETYGPVDPYAH